MLLKRKYFFISILLFLFISFCNKTEEQPVKRMKIEILNGSNISGLANELTKYIRSNYFSYYDVRKIGNASESNYDKSIIIYRRKRYENDAQQLAKILSIEECLYIGNDSDFAALSVILGKDFKIPQYKK